MLKTVMTNYLNLVSPDALEFLTPLDLEVIWTATIAAGGVPNDPKMARLVIAAKYALAHKGVLLER